MKKTNFNHIHNLVLYFFAISLFIYIGIFYFNVKRPNTEEPKHNLFNNSTVLNVNSQAKNTVNKIAKKINSNNIEFNNYYAFIENDSTILDGGQTEYYGFILNSEINTNVTAETYQQILDYLYQNNFEKIQSSHENIRLLFNRQNLYCQTFYRTNIIHNVSYIGFSCGVEENGL